MPSEELTVAKLKGYAVSQEQGRDVWHDTREPGLGIRVSWTGKKVWQVMYRVKGNPTKRRMDLGTYPAITLSDARELAREAKVKAARGEDPAAKHQAEKGVPLFKDLAADYVRLYVIPNKRERSAKEDQRILTKDVLPHWKNKKASDIRRRDVIELLDKVKARGVTVHANRVLAVVRRLFNWTIERDILEASPCAQVKAPSDEIQRDRVLTEDEIRRFWVACDEINQVVAASFKLRLLTAQRGGEVQTMRWEDLDLENGWWTIPSERAKNGLSHRVPLSPPVVAILKGLPQKNEWVFPSRMVRGGHLTNPHASSKLLRDKSGLKFELHDLRRTAASHMASMGVQRLVISKVLNHVETGITAVYDRHSYDSEKRQALGQWGAKVIAIVQNKS